MYKDTPNLTQVFDAALRQDLACFIIRAFHAVNPGTIYVPNWHVDLIAEYLSACSRGEITRLVINLPPRSLKSLCISVAWPAWLLGRDPSMRIIAASYAQNISLKHSLDCRLIIQSDWYKNLFSTRLTSDQNQKFKFQTTKRGYRIATSVGGSITGEGANFLIVDDPHNPIEIHSRHKREQVLAWYDQVFATRADDKQKSVHVVVMQRLHEQDLAGCLLERGWEHLVLPLYANKKTYINYGTVQKEWQENELLQPERDNKVIVSRLKQDMGAQAFSAQYLQKPLPEAGALLKQGWLGVYNVAPKGNIIMSWDTAIKAQRQNDYSVCTVWCEGEAAYYLLDVFRDQIEYPAIKRAAINLAEKWKPKAILIEDKASGQVLLQELKKETRLPLIAILPKQDKLTRFSMVSSLFEAGKILLPKSASWNADYEAELLSFPYGLHDDQVDSTSQYLNWTLQKNFNSPNMRTI